MEEKVFNLKVGLFIIVSFSFIYRSISHRVCFKSIVFSFLFNPTTNKDKKLSIEVECFRIKYNLTMSQIYRRPSQLDILLQKLFEGWHAENVKQHFNFCFATRTKGVKMTIAESCR